MFLVKNELNLRNYGLEVNEIPANNFESNFIYSQKSISENRVKIGFFVIINYWKYIIKLIITNLFFNNMFVMYFNKIIK